MNIIEKFKNRLFNTNIFEKSKNEKLFLETLKYHNIGDVIWAKRYDFDFEKDIISSGHQMGPYIVVGKTEDKLICLYCTGKYKKNELELSDYDFFNKKTYVQTSQIRAIDFESYSFDNYYYHNSLNNIDTKKIIKLLIYNNINLSYNYFGINNSFELNSNIELEIGDVVLHNSHYSLIIDKSDNGLIGVLFDNYDPVSSNINFENVNFNFRNRYLINPNRTNYINSLSSKQLEIVKMKYNNYLDIKYKVDNNIIERGGIIKIGENLYYIYHSDSYKSKAYLITKTNEENEKVIKGKNNYLIDFNEEKTINNKEDYYRIIEYLDEKNIDLIREKKKNFVKNNKLNNVKSSENLFNFGNIIQSKKMYSLRYIVLGIINDKLITISFDSFLSGKILYKEFNILDDSLYISNDYNSKELKVLKENIAYLKELLEEKSIELKK